jgi:hypothetical protein
MTIYLRNCGNQATSQPTEFMISLAICLGDCRFLPLIRHIRSKLVCHLDGIYGRRRRSHRSVALAPVSGGLVDGVKGLVNFTSHGERSGSGTASSKWKAVKDGSQEREAMGLDALSGAQLYMCNM